MTTIIKWLSNAYVLGMLVTAGIVTDFIVFGREAGFEKADWASWVQAVGSIFAIVGAFAIGKHQADVQRQVAERARQELVGDKHATVKGIVDRVFQLCLDVEAHIADQTKPELHAFAFLYIEANVPAAQRLLEDIPLFALGSADLVHATLDMQKAAQGLVAGVEMFRRRPTGPGDGLPISEKHALWRLEDRIKQARKAYEAVIAITGGAPVSTPQKLL